MLVAKRSICFRCRASVYNSFATRNIFLHKLSLRHASTLWQNFQQANIRGDLHFKKSPDYIKENLQHVSTEKSLQNSTSNIDVAIRTYCSDIFHQYKLWMKDKQFEEVIRHFEQRLLVINETLMVKAIEAAYKNYQHVKGVEIYEKYSPLFPNPKVYCSYIVRCYSSLKRRQDALEALQKYTHLLLPDDVAFILQEKFTPFCIIKYILEEPSLHPFLQIEQLKELLHRNNISKSYLNNRILVLLKDLEKQKTPQHTSHNALVIFSKDFETVLEEYKKASTNWFDASELLSIIQKVRALHVPDAIPVFVSKANSVLSKDHFSEFLLGVCNVFFKKDMFAEAVSIFVEYCAPDATNYQDLFFRGFMFHAIEKTRTFTQAKESLLFLQQFFKKFQYLDTNRDKEPYVDKYLCFYYLILGENDAAKQILPQLANYLTFEQLLQYFVEHRLYDRAKFVWEHLSPEKHFKQIHVKNFIYYFISLLNLRLPENIIAWYKAQRSQGTLLHVIPKQYILRAAAEINDMEMFQVILEEMNEQLAAERVPWFRFDEKCIESLLLALKRHQQFDFIVKLKQDTLSKYSSQIIEGKIKLLIQEAENIEKQKQDAKDLATSEIKTVAN